MSEIFVCYGIQVNYDDIKKLLLSTLVVNDNFYIPSYIRKFEDTFSDLGIRNIYEKDDDCYDFERHKYFLYIKNDILPNYEITSLQISHKQLKKLAKLNVPRQYYTCLNIMGFDFDEECDPTFIINISE